MKRQPTEQEKCLPIKNITEGYYLEYTKTSTKLNMKQAILPKIGRGAKQRVLRGHIQIAEKHCFYFEIITQLQILL